MAYLIRSMVVWGLFLVNTCQWNLRNESNNCLALLLGLIKPYLKHFSEEVVSLLLFFFYPSVKVSALKKKRSSQEQ